jgi:hypothetical protein
LTNRFLLSALSSVFLLGAAALAQSGMPPLIERELMFGSSEISGAQISPDGKFIAFRKPHKGVDLTRLVLFDPETGKEEVVESDPLSRVDLDGAAFSAAATRNHSRPKRPNV